MNRGRLIRLALAELALLGVYGLLAWAVWQITHPRIPALLSWAATISVLAAGVGGYLRHALPWWRNALAGR